MGRRVVPWAPDLWSGLGIGCPAGPACPASGSRGAPSDGPSWMETTFHQWGPCGRLAYVDDHPAGFLLYAPPAFVPRSDGFATAPVSPDAVLLVTGWVEPEHRGSGLGKALVQSMAKDLVQREVRAVEAYASEPAKDCLLPTGFLAAVGFAPVRAHVSTPRMRLDLRTTVRWGDVESVWGRVRGVVRPVVAGSAQPLTRSGSRIVPVGASSSAGR